MGATDSSLILKIERRGENGKLVPIDIIGNYLIRLQNLVYHCGELIAEQPFRPKGKIPEDVQKRCRLVMKNASISSFEQTLVLEDDQSVLFDKTLGQDSIELTSDLIRSISAQNQGNIISELEERLPNRRYRSRILRDLHNMVPDPSEDINLIYRGPDKMNITLRSENGPILKGVIGDSRKESITLLGVLSEIRVTAGKRSFELFGPEGRVRIRYRKEMIEKILRYIQDGKPITLVGIAKLKNDDTIDIVEDLTSIEYLKTIERHRIISSEYDIRLSRPLVLEIDYSEDRWVMENKELSLKAQDKDYSNCLRDIEEEFAFIYNEYSNTEDNELTKDALHLKRILKTMVKEN